MRTWLIAVLVLSIDWIAVPGAQSAARTDAFAERIRNGSDVAWLEQIAGSGDFLLREYRARVGRDTTSAEWRVEAFARLGALATRESLAAIDRIEARLAGQRTLDTQQSDWFPTPAASYGGSSGLWEPEGAARIDNREYAPRLLELYGPFAPYLSWRLAGSSTWSRPYLVGPPVANSWSFTPKIERQTAGVILSFHRPPRMSPDVAVPSAVGLDLAILDNDSDGDGWTDFEEKQLGMNPANRDSDADGVPDDMDASPLHAATAAESTDDEAQLLRKAWFAMYGVRGSRYALFVPPGLGPLQLQGLPGPVLFGVELPSRAGCGRGPRRDCSPIRGGAEARWTIIGRTDTAAIVEFTNYLGSGFMSAARVELRKIEGRWVVVRYGLARIT